MANKEGINEAGINSSAEPPARPETVRDVIIVPFEVRSTFCPGSCKNLLSVPARVMPVVPSDNKNLQVQ